MGTSTSWVAVEGAGLDEIARALQLARAPAGAEPRYLAAARSGWLLLIAAMEGNGLVASGHLLWQLSRHRRVVACDEESHVMYSAACEWRGQRERWAVVHASERAPDHLDTRGDLPPGSAALLQAATADDEVDLVYEIPLEIARLVVGYRTESDEDDELELVPLVTAPRRWWRFW